MTTLAFTGRLSELKPEQRHQLVGRGAMENVRRDVSAIAHEVRDRGDAALRDLTLKFDGVDVDRLSVARDEWRAAFERLQPDVREALQTAHANIERFHRACLPQDHEIEVVPGLRAGRRIVPYKRVGAYVPGGRASYPSTVLMTVTPARVAGVRQVVVVTPPGKDGKVPEATLAACYQANVDAVYAVGGAQAVFALAYGTHAIPKVDKIVGPGNAWVAAAKAHVAGEVSIDAPAGPSEVLVIADEQADATLAAREMLAQAEHDPRAACVAIATTDALASAIAKEVERLLADAPRGEVVAEALATHGAVLSASHESALAFSDEFGPEHLVLLTREPRRDLARLHNYGSAFLGQWSSVALGDYCAGPNHVLPTAGLARSYSALSVDDFVRRPTHQEATREALQALAPVAETLARLEGLPNHAAAVEERRKRA